jgi:hypothetical protein
MRTDCTRPRASRSVLVALVACSGCYDGIDGDTSILARVQATPEAVCAIDVDGVGRIDLENDYLPHVVHCENGGAGFEALKAQAIAARSVAYHAMATHGRICDGQGCQVYSCGSGPTEEQRRAVAETAGQVLTYGGQLTYGFYVAGDAASAPPTCFGDIAKGTEKYVTDNVGAIGDAVEQTELGWIYGPNDAGYGTNRGCMSQWGARCLEHELGYSAEQILRAYYGADIGIMQALGTCIDDAPGVPPPEPPPPLECDPLLAPNEVLFTNESVRSCNGLYVLWMQDDGNVVLYEEATGRPLWATSTAGTIDPALVMQEDGNFVLYDGAGTAVWHTGTHGNAGATMRVEDDGNVIVWDGWTALWRAR